MVSPRVPDLDSLALLLEIATTGSLGRAAAAQGISQPAVSAACATMEGLVGVPWWSAPPRLVANPGGVLVAGWARDVLARRRGAGRGIASLRAGPDQQLGGGQHDGGRGLLPRWLVRLAADRPEHGGEPGGHELREVQRAVLAGEVELGFVEGPEVASRAGSRVVARDRLVVVVAPGHPWARRRGVDAAELAATRLVQREPTSGTRTALELALAAQGPLATPLLELSTATAVRAAVGTGAGPAVLSRLAVADDLETGRLVAVAVRGADLGRDLRAVWPRGRRLSHPGEDLLRIATDRAPRAAR